MIVSAIGPLKTSARPWLLALFLTTSFILSPGLVLSEKRKAKTLSTTSKKTTPSPIQNTSAGKSTGSTGSTNCLQVLDSKLFPNYLQLAVDACNAGQPIKALQHLSSKEEELKGSQRLSRSSPEKLYLLKGMAEAALNRHEAAAGQYRQSLRYRAAYADAHFLLARSLAELKQNAQAISALQDALWFFRPNSSAALVKEADIYLSLAQLWPLEESRDQTQVAVFLDKALQGSSAGPSDTAIEARLQRAAMARNAGERGKALSLLNEALALDPANQTVKLQLTKTLLQGLDRDLDKEDLQQARQLTDQLMQQQADSAAVRAAQIEVLLAQGELDAAQKASIEALKLHANNPELLRLRSQVALEKEALASSVAQASESEALQ
jgi:tetratricopeptide (TPR) repeat protein